MGPRYACAIAASSPSRKLVTPATIAYRRAVPRAGDVNARRPGHRPGRSAAKSIDDGEHGASIEHAMVQAHIRGAAVRARILEKECAS